jgi:hypothetical protein
MTSASPEEAPRWDRRHAEAYLESLTGATPPEPCTFQTIPERNGADASLARILHGTLEELGDQLEELNAAGAGVFVAVNGTDLQGRTAENVVAVRALFADFDGGPPSKWALEPSFFVQSARGPHPYWLTEPGAPLDRFSGAQIQLAEFYGSDRSVHDLPRVMRLPGFLHCKAEPRLVTFEGGSQRRYSLEEVLAAHPVKRAAAPATEVPQGDRPGIDPAQVLRGVDEGGRDETLYRYACKMRRRNFELAEAEALILLAARACRPAFPDSEALRKVEQAWKHPPAAPLGREEVSPPAIEDRAPRGARPDDWIRPGEGLAARVIPTERVSLASTFPTLHRNTREGLPTGATVGILGGPDSGKTGVAMTMADVAERQGWTVIHLTNDNGCEPAEVRWGQMMGFDRSKLETGDAQELADFKTTFAARRIWMPDPELVDERLRPINTLQHVIEEGKKRFAGQKVLLLVDSPQVIEPDGKPQREERLRILAVMKLLRSASMIPGWIVVAPTQINREAFKFRNQSKNTRPLTAGAGTAGIEFGFDLMLFLDPEGCPEGRVGCAVTKNKPGAGRKPQFLIEWDQERARASEPDEGLLEEEALAIAKEEAEKLNQKILAAISGTQGASTHIVKAMVRGPGCAEKRVETQMQALLREQRLRVEQRGNSSAKHWFLGESERWRLEGAR